MTAPAPRGGERLPECNWPQGREHEHRRCERQEFEHHRCELRLAEGQEFEHRRCGEEAGGRAGCDGSLEPELEKTEGLRVGVTDIPLCGRDRGGGMLPPQSLTASRAPFLSEHRTSHLTVLKLALARTLHLTAVELRAFHPSHSPPAPRRTSFFSSSCPTASRSP